MKYLKVLLLFLIIIFETVNCQNLFCIINPFLPNCNNCKFTKSDVESAFKQLVEIDPVIPNHKSGARCTVDCTGYLTTKDDYERCLKIYNKENSKCNRKLCDKTMTLRRNECEKGCNYVNKGDPCPMNQYGDCIRCGCTNGCSVKKCCKDLTCAY